MAEQGPEPTMPPIGDGVPERPAEPTLSAGLERRDEFVVEGALVTDVGGTIETSVLSTPGMIAMMERCSSVLSYENLPQGSATVGFEVCIKHVSAALAGTTCAVHSVLTEVIENRKLRFTVEVTQEDRTIGLGTHERRVITPDRLG
jgi:predicted thioesterase